MKTQKFTLGQQINAGNFIVSIGIFDTSDVAICSKSSGRFVTLDKCKRSKTLRLVKKLHGTWLNSNTTFTFQWMTDDRTQDLIDLLKTK